MFAAPPEITLELGETEGIEDQSVSIECRASGDPPPVYDFYKVRDAPPVYDFYKVRHPPPVYDFYKVRNAPPVYDFYKVRTPKHTRHCMYSAHMTAWAHVYTSKY